MYKLNMEVLRDIATLIKFDLDKDFIHTLSTEWAFDEYTVEDYIADMEANALEYSSVDVFISENSSNSYNPIAPKCTGDCPNCTLPDSECIPF